MADAADAQVVDPGVDENIKKLTPERIEQVINRVLTEECAARLRIYLDTCVHCGLCADSCQSYLSRDRDPDFAPVAKVKDTLWQMVRRKGKVDGEFLRNAARIAYLECGACRRCNSHKCVAAAAVPPGSSPGTLRVNTGKKNLGQHRFSSARIRGHVSRRILR